MKDIYFTDDYCKVSESIEEGQAGSFNYKGKEGSIEYSFIKRKIDAGFQEGNECYDIISPYGYGGPVILEKNETSSLVNKFEEEFSKFCKRENIVSEFVRFHPIIANHQDFETLYNIQYSRNTIGTDLKSYENPFQEEFSKSTRKLIRKLLKDGVTYNIVENPENMSEFIDVYYSTMDRNDSKEFYYFSKDYFNSLLKKLKENIILVSVFINDTVIAMGLYFKYDNYLHAHLSGTKTEYISLSPAYIIKYAITEWGKNNDYHLIHHGGGISENREDNLFKFKKKFGKNTEFEFYTGKKVWNQDLYDELCNMHEVDKNTEFFPAYRA